MNYDIETPELIKPRIEEAEVRKRTDYITPIEQGHEALIVTFDGKDLNQVFYVHIDYDHGRGTIKSASQKKSSIDELVDLEGSPIGIVGFDGIVTKYNIKNILETLLDHPQHYGRMQIADDFEFVENYN